MGQPRTSRHGSMQFWPRKRARRIYPRVRAWPENKDAKLLGFAGYKVGMTHVTYVDNRKTVKKKGEERTTAVTVIECPPLKIASVRFYKKAYRDQLKLLKEIPNKVDKDLGRKLKLPKEQKEPVFDDINLQNVDMIRVKVYTQPRLSGYGKKRPEVFEVGLGGSKEQQLAYIKDHLSKEIPVSEVFKPGQLLDFHGVTKGKGLQGPVKRFGVAIRSHKAEKTKRGPGSLGAWRGQAHMMYRVAHAGQMGFHTRTDMNKWLVKISDKPEEINPKDGFLSYGLVKTQYLLVKGSVSGARKRLVRFNAAIRPARNVPSEAPTIIYTSLESKQGN
ncbi:50S ribosomal protein L3 [Candidatus Woesearchaeota archaeon]|nr:50S ribosomal protein L3 [Candidatus Woesearchaeota archaeon]